MIPCEFCGKLLTLSEYGTHILTHSPNDTFADSNSFQPPSYNNNFSIPCEQCNQHIPINEYEPHLLMHSLTPACIPITSNNKVTIPCPICNKQIAFDEYESHQLIHIDDGNNNNNNNRFMVECPYKDCAIKWIPKSEYEDHLTVHTMQSAQQPNTTNDELIALNHQTQIIQQQTAMANSIRNIPDPRRINLSQSFSHLHGTQKPVIPMHDLLTTNISHLRYRSLQLNATKDAHCVDGIIESIEHVLSAKDHIDYFLCDPLTFYYRASEDYSWGCGFRNAQTVSSSLIMKRNRATNGRGVYSKVLFDGIGYVPIIQQIQRYLDNAHQHGFDPEGFQELGNTTGRGVWIGAVDVAAILRSFYIPASIFDFQLSSTNNANNVYHDDMFDWVWDYFEQRYKYHNILQKRHQNGGNQTLISSFFQSEDVMMQKALEQSKKEMDDSDSGTSDDDDDCFFDPNKNYKKEEKKDDDDDDDDDNELFVKSNSSNNTKMKDKKRHSIDYNKRFIPPLYFQHQGHSRTIIGIIHNHRSGLRHLLVLDPSVKNGGISLLNKIKNGNVSPLLRSKKQIRATKYQIIAIPHYGIMTNEDRNRCKTIQSMDVTLMNKNKQTN